ncbi:MAG TPA: ABC transporter ATP-binding protein, partial [Pyrinomonadaceae bacterium]
GAEPGSAASLDLKKAAAEIRKVSDEFKLAVDPNATIESLSVGQQQRVELLKALYRHAQLLILDEPTAVLTPQEVEEFFAILRSMREQGKTIVIITHKLDEVLAISDNVTVMRDGKVVGNVKTRETNAAALARMMVGREVLLRVEKPDAKPAGTVLDVRDLSIVGRDGTRRLNNVSLEIHAGEIVGIAGVEGNGQTELIEALAGLIPGPYITGTINFEGRDITRADARRRKELGIAHVPEDRHRRGLLLDFSLAENTILGVHYRKPAVRGVGNIMLDEKGIQRRTEQVLRDFDVRPPNAALPARALSGGNQQKLIIGREFELPPKLLLVSQPTRGVDIGAIEFIHRKIVEMRDAGCAVLLVSAELEEVTALSDRLIVVHDGEIVGEVDPKVATNEEIGLMMTGGHG